MSYSRSPRALCSTTIGINCESIALRRLTDRPAFVIMKPMLPLNLPNLLTLIRILLVPVVVVALLIATPNGDLLAAVVFILASLTDLLDGYLARSRDNVTSLGKLLDPIADKLLITGALIALVSLGRVAAWV